jgi:hypothetical protein
MAEATTKPASIMDKNPQSHPTDSDHDTFSDEKLIEKAPVSHETTFPEGGARAWGVAIGAAGVLFSTFGYANAFGYVSLLPSIPKFTDNNSVFQEYYQTHQLRNETPSSISWIGSLQIFFLFGGTLFGGPLFDRFGEKVNLS